MNEEDRNNKNAVLISYIKSIISNYKIKAEYSTNDNDKNVIVVQQASGNKVVFYDNDNPLFNYFNIYIYGDSIESEYKTAIQLGDLIGKHEIVEFETNSDNNYTPQKWQIIFKQYTNPRTITYYDIKRVAYTMTFQCIVNRIQ